MSHTFVGKSSVAPVTRALPAAVRQHLVGHDGHVRLDVERRSDARAVQRRVALTTAGVTPGGQLASDVRVGRVRDR